jgi:hypothetical protein
MTATQTEVLADSAPASRPSKPPVIEFRTEHDLKLAGVALEHRVEELKKLQKKNDEEGYAREARAISADAAAIEHHLLPQLRAQRELPLLSTEQLQKEVEAALSRAVHQAFEQLDNPKAAITPEGIRSRRAHLIAKLASRVIVFARELAEASWNDGYQARGQSTERLTLNALESLRGAD